MRGWLEVAYAIALVLLAAATARGQEVDWTGSWAIDGGGEARVTVAEGRYVLSTALPVSGVDRNVTFRGSASGSSLALDGTAQDTRGLTGALSGDEKKGSHACTLRATAKGDDAKAETVVDARYSVDGGEVRRETWRRAQKLLEIIALEVDEKPLSGAYDVKSAKTRLVVRYRLNGANALPLTLRVVVGGEHAYADFYASPRIFEGALGAVEPGEHTCSWDGRDQTPAHRIALEGGYDVIVLADEERSAKSHLRVAAPHFEFVSGNSWGKSGRDGVAVSTYGPPRVAQLESKGYASVGSVGPIEGVGQLEASLQGAACVIVSSHGAPGHVTFYAGDGTVPKLDETQMTIGWAAKIALLDLKDMHLALLSSCNSARELDTVPSLAEAFQKAGCDTVIAFRDKINSRESLLYEDALMALVARGNTIAKSARDAAYTAYRQKQGDESLSDSEINARVAEEATGEGKERSMLGGLAVFRAPGAQDDDEFWPPRYGDHEH